MYHMKWAWRLYSGSYLKLVKLSKSKSLENQSQDLKVRPVNKTYSTSILFGRMKLKQNPAPPLASDPSFPAWEPDGLLNIRPQYKSIHEQWRGLNSSLDSNPSWHHSTDIIITEDISLLFSERVSSSLAICHYWDLCHGCAYPSLVESHNDRLNTCLDKFHIKFPSSDISLYSMKSHNEMLILSIILSADRFWTVSWQTCDWHRFHHVQNVPPLHSFQSTWQLISFMLRRFCIGPWLTELLGWF